MEMKSNFISLVHIKLLSFSTIFISKHKTAYTSTLEKVEKCQSYGNCQLVVTLLKVAVNNKLLCQGNHWIPLCRNGIYI